MQTGTNLDQFVDTLKAMAESSRLRILVLLSRGDLTVSDLTDILGQSQPRVSRHLKLLLDARLIARYQEGSWAYFCLSPEEAPRDLIDSLTARINVRDRQLERDLERLDDIRHRRLEQAQAYFAANAAEWNEMRSLHAPDAAVETALLEVIGDRPIQTMLDLGTGTGRMLELFAPLYRRGVGIDTSHEMLSIARSNLDKAGITHAQVRKGDVYAPPVERDHFDLVTAHQMLHYLDNPALAIREAARLLRPAGRLAIIDFAPHDLEFLRDEHAHLRLGFSDQQMAEWFTECGLDLEETVQIEEQNGTGQKLVVKLWLARDRRMLIADPVSADTLKETA